MPLQSMSFGGRDIKVPACPTAPCRHYYRQDPDWVQDIEERLAYPQANEKLWDYFFSLLGPLSLNPYCAEDWKGRDPRLQRCHRIFVKEGFVGGMKRKAESMAEKILGRMLHPGDYADDPYLWHLFERLGIAVDLDAEVATAEANF
jgi:hypothetical protein